MAFKCVKGESLISQRVEHCIPRARPGHT